MLTSNGNQYLRPEYLTPLPTTLDAKKSPLALLAQTCSQIGADTPTTKSLLPPLDKTTNKKSETPRDKSSPASSISSCSPINVKSSFKPYDSNHVTDDKSANRVKTPVKSTTPSQNGGRCSSNQSASSPRSSPSSRKTPASQELPATSKSDSSMKASPPPTKASDAPAFKSTSSSTLPPVTSAGFLGYPGCPLPLDVMASSLLSHPLKPGLNPYFSYTRMKTANGTDTLVPVCRDPYCTGCQLSSHLLGSPGGKSTCPAGCAQCEGKAAGFLPTPGHHTSAVAAAYAHAQLAALAAASQLPYVCSWIAGDATYCGKRFSNSEELLQHLRTHTSDSLLTSPSSHPLLHRTYPTPPLSPLSTARYHPYSKPPLLPPSLTSAFPLPPHPGLPPYFSPYSLYGPRLGTSSGMHP